MSIFNKKKLKNKFTEEKLKISKQTLEKLAKVLEENIKHEINNIIRQTKLSGRKVIRQEDFN
ncbi:MAG: hypothetical protein U9Q06_01440 [Nanoarchaeota archaeon]|nr:hypothetical protein [Nanoarchaeota archaeon]